MYATSEVEFHRPEAIDTLEIQQFSNDCRKLLRDCDCWVFNPWSSFQMTVESNNVIAIATLCDWLKRLASVFQPVRSVIFPAL